MSRRCCAIGCTRRFSGDPRSRGRSSSGRDPRRSLEFEAFSRYWENHDAVFHAAAEKRAGSCFARGNWSDHRRIRTDYCTGRISSVAYQPEPDSCHSKGVRGYVEPPGIPTVSTFHCGGFCEGRPDAGWSRRVVREALQESGCRFAEVDRLQGGWK